MVPHSTMLLWRATADCEIASCRAVVADGTIFAHAVAGVNCVGDSPENDHRSPLKPITILR
jgi:hypothetical protein